MNARISTLLVSAIALCGAVTAGTYAWQNAEARKPEAKSDQPPAHAQGQQTGMPNLIELLKEAPGCLGVDAAQTMSGKRVIFSWFETKQDVVNWYYSEPHQKVMDQFFTEHPVDFKPLDGVPDDAGPLLVIASLTMSDGSKHEETSLPVSQIAIELYQPVNGGLYLGGRFAPDTVKVKDMHDYSEQPETKAQD